MMRAMNRQITELGDWHTSVIADFLCSQCNEASELEGGEWLKDDYTMFSIAGYDYLEDGTFQLVLLALFRHNGTLILNEPVNERFILGGF